MKQNKFNINKKVARKVIQISESTGHGKGGHWNCTALCDDGTMWIIHTAKEQWVQLPDVPQDNKE